MTTEINGDDLASVIFELGWAGRTLTLPEEYRKGAKFSKSTLDVLKGMYGDMQHLDGFISSWLPQLSELLGSEVLAGRAGLLPRRRGRLARRHPARAAAPP